MKNIIKDKGDYVELSRCAGYQKCLIKKDKKIKNFTFDTNEELDCFLNEYDLEIINMSPFMVFGSQEGINLKFRFKKGGK